MKGFIKVVKEVNSTLNDILIFEIILNSILIFLIVYILFSIGNLNPFFALVPALVYFAVVSREIMQKNKARIVEGKYDILKEKLRTAADNINAENPIVDELQSEVIQEMRNVRASSFVNTRRVAYKITGCVILCFAIIFIATLNIRFFDLKVIFDKIPEYIIGNSEPSEGSEGGVLGASMLGEDDAIYGAESIAEIGDKEMKVEIKPVGAEITIRDVREASEKRFEEQFPEDVFLKSAESASEENIDDKDLIKNYFLNIAKG